MEFLKIVLSAAVSVAAIFLIAKIMGHKQVAQLDFFDYISGITIGSVAAELATSLEEAWKPLTALAVYGAASILLSLITHKLPKTRKYVNGTPTILMSGGKLYRDNLKKAKLDLSEFLLLCRERGYFDLDDIEVAVFEHNGKLSVLPRSQKRPATPEDLGIATADAHIGTEIIMDGRIMGENLARIGKNEVWLRKRLKELREGVPEAIFLAIYRASDDSITVYKTK